MASRKVKSTIQSLLREMRSDIKASGPDGWDVGTLHEFVDVGHRGTLNIGVYQKGDGSIGTFVRPYCGSRKLARARSRHWKETGHKPLKFLPVMDESGAVKHYRSVDCCDELPKPKGGNPQVIRMAPE